MTPSNCPYCRAPLPAAKSGAVPSVILCPSCGKAIVTAGSAVGGPTAGKASSPAKTLMWTGGLPPGLAAKPSAPAAAVPSRLGTPATDKPVSPGAAAVPPGAGVARGDAKLGAYSAVAATAAAKRRVETAEFAVAATMVPPPHDPEVPPARVEVKPAADSRGPAAVDVDMSFESSVAPAGGAAAAADPPAAEPASDAGAPFMSSDEPSSEPADAKGQKEAESEPEAVPEWAGSAPSVATVSRLKGGRRKYFFVVGGVGVLALAVVGVAVLAGGGKKPAISDQRPAPVKAVEKAAVPTQPVVEKPTPPTAVAAVEPAKPQPAVAEKSAIPAASKPAAAEKVAALAEKPARSEKVAVAPSQAVEKPRPIEKKVAAEKPAPAERPVSPKVAASPKAAVEKPVAEKVPAPSEPAAPPPEKTQTEAAPPAAKSASNKTQEASEAYQRGNAKLLNGALPEAIAAFSEALKFNPKDPQSQRGLGMAYAQSGNAAQAVRHFKLYLKALPSAPDRALIEKRINQLGGR